MENLQKWAVSVPWPQLKWNNTTDDNGIIMKNNNNDKCYQMEKSAKQNQPQTEHIATQYEILKLTFKEASWENASFDFARLC